MTRAALATSAALAAVTLSACTGQPDGPSVNSGLAGSMSEWTDPDTGCVYLFYSESLVGTNARTAALTIRYNRDGTPDCPRSGATQ